MSHVYIKDISTHEGQTVTVKGWLANRRSSGKLHFLQLRDGTGFIQAVMFKGDFDEETFKAADHLPQESAVAVTGEVKKDRKGNLEIGASALEVISEAAPDFPLGHKEHGPAFLMDNRHLWLRSTRQHAILRIRHTIIKAIRDFFDDRDFTLVDAPIFTPAACEGTSTLFEVPYFDMGSAYLTQSGQLYGEAAAMAVGKAYVFGPTFRAEKSKTRRHLTEFWMVEPEVAFLDLDGDMQLAEDFLVHIVERVLAKHRDDLATLERDVAKLETVKGPFPRITYTEAIDRINKARPDNPIPWGDDLGAEDETILANQFDRPVMVHRYPTAMKAFYFKRDPEDEKVALGMDVLAPEGYGEIIGGGQREESYDALVERLKEHNLPQEAFEWYLDLRKFGSVPHSGFGLGLERTVAWICGLHHVRETIPFARLIDRLTP